MTITPKPNPKYDAHKPKPSTVSIGVSIASKEQEELEYGYLTPAKTACVFMEIPYEKAYLKCGGCDYKYVKQKLKELGWGASFSIMSVWICETPPKDYI